MISGGTASARGFEYQIEASIWITLELLLRADRARAVEVEPVNSEDMQADLFGDAIEASVCAVSPNGYRALYQMKTRGTGPWTSSSLRGVIGDGLPRAVDKRGQAPRPLALELLCNDKRNIYFFITDAAVDKSLHKLSDRELTFEPSEVAVPPEFLADEIRLWIQSVVATL
jgi:hypothetical protein